MIKDLTKFNRDLKNIVTWILEEMPHSKKRVLLNALERNFELTSSWILVFTLPTSVKMQEDLISGFNSSKYFVIVTTGVQIKMISQPENCSFTQSVTSSNTPSFCA